MKKSFKIFFFSSIIMLFVSLSVAGASVVLQYPRQLGYGNGTFVTLPAGTYSNVTRINGVWYVDGAVFPVASSAPVPTPGGGGVIGPAWTPSPGESAVPSSGPSESHSVECSDSPAPSEIRLGPVSFDMADLFWVIVAVVVVALLALLITNRRKKSSDLGSLFEGSRKHEY